MLVAGVSSDDLTGRVDIYDAVSGWSEGPKLPSDFAGAVAAPLPGGRALVAGGVPSLGATDSPSLAPVTTAVTYNPATGKWTKVGNMSVPRSDATATALRDGRVLVAGGRPNAALATSQFFNPSSSTWTAGPPLAHGRFDHVAVALKDGRVLVVGGSAGQDPLRPLNSAELFDPTLGRWLDAGTIGAPRTQFTLTALQDGRALLAGGLAADGSTVLRSTFFYDPARNTWSAGPELAYPRTAHAAAVLADGRVLVTGGADLVGRLASSEVLDPVGKSWSATGSLATPRSSHLAVTLPTGRIMVVGGHGPGGGLASAELYDPFARGIPAADRAPSGPGQWKLAASEPLDFGGSSARLLADGRVMVLPTLAYGDFVVQVYDPKLDAWTTPFSRKQPPCGNCGLGGPSPPVFVAGPLGNSKFLLLTVDPQRAIAGKAEVIDLTTGKATPAASPGKVGQSRLYLLPDGRVWLTADSLVDDRHALLYSPTTNHWTATSNVPVELGGRLQSMTDIPGRRVLVTGALKAMVYDPASGLWTDGGSFPNADNASYAVGLPVWTGFSAARLASGDVLLAGGSELTGATSGGAPIYTATARVTRWDHSTGLLAPAGSMPEANSNQSVAVLSDGRVLLAGGGTPEYRGETGDPLARAAIYDSVTRSWALAASLPAARSDATAVTLADGRVLLVGGSGIWLDSSLQSSRPPSLVFSPQ